jgi:hypothetical protein
MFTVKWKIELLVSWRKLIIFIIILFQGRNKDIYFFNRKCHVCMSEAGRNEYLRSKLLVNVALQWPVG